MQGRCGEGGRKKEIEEGGEGTREVNEEEKIRQKEMRGGDGRKEGRRSRKNKERKGKEEEREKRI